MKCPRKNKNCNQTLMYKCSGGDFICSGINTKPTKYKKDNVWFCMKGQLSKTGIEMTIQEVAFIVSVLSATLGEIAPSILTKKKCL